MNIEDIAKKAGVSRSTVSRVINNEPYVSARTRARVQEIIKRENFSPNPSARALVLQRTRVIGVVVPHTANIFFGDNSYYPQLLQGASDAINEGDHAMLLWLQHSDENREAFASRVIRNRQMDGLVLCSMTVEDPMLLRVLETGIPFVSVERPADYLLSRVSYVTVDNVQAARTAVEHLIRQGYQHIAHITGQLTISDGADRLIGYRQALELAGRRFDPTLVAEGIFNYASGYECMKRLLKRSPLPDAVFTSDTIALGAMDAIREAGLRIPEDVAVVGFDDLDVATKSTPQLTTIRQPVQQKGAYAARILIDMLDGKIQPPRHVLLPTELVIRQSCGGL